MDIRFASSAARSEESSAATRAETSGGSARSAIFAVTAVGTSLLAAAIFW